MAEWQPVFDDYMDPDSEHYESSDLEDKLMELENQFHKELQEDYLSMLRREYEYLTSEEVIIEALECNGYEFLDNGSIY